MHFYIYSDGHHQEILTFDELLITLDEDDGEGIRIPHAMTEEEFLTHLACQENNTIHYWFYNSVWLDQSNFLTQWSKSSDPTPTKSNWLGDGYYNVWYTADIQLYDEHHILFGDVDGHEKYLESIRKNQERLENCYCMSDLVCGACR